MTIQFHPKSKATEIQLDIRAIKCMRGKLSGTGPFDIIDHLEKFIVYRNKLIKTLFLRKLYAI